MSITYAQKRAILDHFSNTDLWTKKEYADEAKTRPSLLPHIICLTNHFSNSLKTQGYECLNASKIIISREIDIQPSLKATNEFTPWKFRGLVEYGIEKLKNGEPTNIGKEDIDNLQTEWKDVTEFNGHDVATPFMFSVQMVKDGFNFLFTHTNKERILSHTSLLDQVSRNEGTPQKRERNITPKDLMRTLENGQQMKDHRGNDWVTAAVNQPVAFKAWEAFRHDDMRLSGDHVAAINYDNNRAMIAMEANAFAKRLG